MRSTRTPETTQSLNSKLTCLTICRIGIVMSDEEFIKIVLSSNSKSTICEKMGLAISGGAMLRISKRINRLQLSCAHFDLYAKRRKFLVIEKSCPVCRRKFKTKKGDPKEKIVCSRGCSNTHFRTGTKHSGFKTGITTYRKLVKLDCCNRCGYTEEPRILQVHHKDRDRKNNKIENLEVLCPNCHRLHHLQVRLSIQI